MNIERHLVYTVALYGVAMVFYLGGTTEAESIVGDAFWTVATIWLLTGAFALCQDRFSLKKNHD